MNAFMQRCITASLHEKWQIKARSRFERAKAPGLVLYFRNPVLAPQDSATIWRNADRLCNWMRP